METFENLVIRDLGKIDLGTINPLFRVNLPLERVNHRDVDSISSNVLFYNMDFKPSSDSHMTLTRGINKRCCKKNRKMERCRNTLLIGLLVFLFILLIGYILKKVFDYKLF